MLGIREVLVNLSFPVVDLRFGEVKISPQETDMINTASVLATF